MEAAIENPVIFKGDVPLSIQKQIVAFSDFHLKDVNFARTTGRDLVLTEAAVYKRPEDRKLQSRLVYQITVGEGALRLAYTRPDAVGSHALRYAQQAAHDSRRLHRLPRRRVRSMSPRLARPYHSLPCSHSDARLWASLSSPWSKAGPPTSSPSPSSPPTTPRPPRESPALLPCHSHPPAFLSSSADACFFSFHFVLPALRDLAR